MGGRLRLQAVILLVGALLVSALAPGAAHAEGASWAEKIKLGLHLRARNEGRFNYDRDSDVGDKDDFTLLRVRLSADARANESVRAFVQVQASRTLGDSCLGSSCPVSGSGPFGPGNAPLGVGADDEGLAIHQGYADLSWGESTLRAGRQEMIFGDQRLVGAFGWSNRGRSFDGVSLIRDTDAYRGQAFFHVIERRPPTFTGPPPGANNNDSFFTGFNTTLKEVGNGVDFYFLVFLDSDGAPCVASPPCNQDENLNIYTLGLRTKDMPAEGLGYDFEGAYQSGENDDRKINAFALHVALGYGLGGDLSPRVLLEYNVASGEDGVGDDNAFKNLFPTNHGKYGYIDFMNWSNMHNLRLGLGAAPADALDVSLDYHLFLAYEKTGAIGMNAGTLAASPARTSRYYGSEFDLLAKYTFEKAAKLLFGYSFFLPGTMFEDTAPNTDDAVHFAYAQLQVDI